MAEEDTNLQERVGGDSSFLQEREMEGTDLLQDTSDDLEADRIMEEWNEQQDQVTQTEEYSNEDSSSL